MYGNFKGYRFCSLLKWNVYLKFKGRTPNLYFSFSESLQNVNQMKQTFECIMENAADERGDGVEWGDN